MPAPQRRMSAAFRKQMLRNAVYIFGALLVTLFVIATSAPGKAFLIAACILIPCAALTFNLVTRRAYAAEQTRTAALRRK